MVYSISFQLCMTLCGMSAASEAPAGVFEAGGELAARIRAVQERFASGIEPAFTDDFVLADVVLDPGYPRRFAEYSGDISGRYIEALTAVPFEGSEVAVRRLTAAALTHQRADGRFGDAGLSYAADDIAMRQMALLWGNGRLLVGLMRYHAAYPGADALAAATRLGDFLTGVYDTCSHPDVIRRLEGQAASGFICFTQLIEGLELLTRATGDTKYRETAARIVPLLEPRGIQHSHGYLTTLRGYMMLHESTGAPEFLDAARTRFEELAASTDYNIYGGVNEYFGGKGATDEGCSEADLLRVALQLWNATGETRYLEFAERCIVNIFHANQHENGDFGHRVYNDHGYVPMQGAGRAWWCCSMHGLRAYRDILDNVITGDADTTRLHLFFEGVYTRDGLRLALSRPAADGDLAQPSFRIVVENAGGAETVLAVRRPSWAEAVHVTLNGAPAEPVVDGDYLTLRRAWIAGDVVELRFDYALRLVTNQGAVLSLSDVGETPVRAALFYGPWLLGVDEDFEPMFHGAPWTDNVLLLPATADAVDRDPGDAASPQAVGDARLGLDYVHGGFPDLCHVTLRPISELTLHRQSMVTVWHNYRRGS